MNERYRIVHIATQRLDCLGEFSVMVDGYCRNGLRPLGAPFLAGGGICQAMVRPEKAEVAIGDEAVALAGGETHDPERNATLAYPAVDQPEFVRKLGEITEKHGGKSAFL